MAISKNKLKEFRGLSDLEIAARLSAELKREVNPSEVFQARRQHGYLTREEEEQIRQGRRNFVKGVAGTGATLAVGGAAWALYRHFSDDGLYERAKNDPALQEKWVKRVLSRYGIENLFGEIIIVTPQNAYKYEKEYNRNKKVGQTSANVAVGWQGKASDLGTTKVPLPKLYVPTELFRLATDGDLESTIAFHEASHARVVRHGLKSVDMGYFRHKDDPTKFSQSMFEVVYELEGHKEGLEKGQHLMSAATLETTRQKYLSYYIQLSRHSKDLDPEKTVELHVKFFQPWMKNSNSIYVYEEGPKVKYGGPIQLPFFVCGPQESKSPCYFQFESKSRGLVQLILSPSITNQIR